MQPIVFSFVITTLLGSTAAFAAEYVPSKRLGFSLATLQQALEKVNRPVTFALRPGSALGTQEARLPNEAGAVQASGDPDNLMVVVLWMPIDQPKKRLAPASREYYDAVVRTVISDTEAAALWIDQVLQRALSEGSGTSHVESQLFDTYQFKAMYVPSMSPPMLSLTVTKSAEE